VTDAAPPTPAIDFATFDRSVRVQDDLFRHVNGTWLKYTPIPADQPLTGAFIELRDQAEAAVRDIITTIESGSPGTDEAKIADLYASFMDEETIEAAGTTPLEPLIRQITAVTSIEELMRLLGSFNRQAVVGLTSFEAESDPGDPNRYVIFVGQGGL
jgi:putative endopeptidase